MKKPAVLVLVLALALAAYATRSRVGDAGSTSASVPASVSAPGPAPGGPGDDRSLRRAIESRADGVAVTGRGVVVRLLADDTEGSPHQRIVLRVAGGGTVLVAHNLELAARIEPIAVGDTLEFGGEYAWNPKGGVVHWTHPDPAGRHRDGWLRRIP